MNIDTSLIWISFPYGKIKLRKKIQKKKDLIPPIKKLDKYSKYNKKNKKRLDIFI